MRSLALYTLMCVRWPLLVVCAHPWPRATVASVCRVAHVKCVYSLLCALLVAWRALWTPAQNRRVPFVAPPHPFLLLVLMGCASASASACHTLCLPCAGDLPGNGQSFTALSYFLAMVGHPT
jgi:hypothetical protein